jgi:hypothetical protein
MGPLPVPMRLAIGKNLTNNHQTICIIEHANGKDF